MKYKYTKKDYDDLENALFESESISYGRPDQYQYYQNQLSKAIAEFLLKPRKEMDKK